MGYINRFLLFIYALLVIFCSLVILALYVHIIPLYALINEIKFILAQNETLIYLGIIIVLSLYWLIYCLNKTDSNTSAEKEFILLHGKNGAINLSLSAVKNLTERIVQPISSVRNVKSELLLTKKKDGASLLKINMKLILSQEQNITIVSDEIHSAIASALHEILGIEDYTLNISIIDVSNSLIDKKQRVV